jgi:hypothetical protein
MATSGTIAIATGSYGCESCGHVIEMAAGDVAPKCPECRHDVGWHLRTDSATRRPPPAPSPGPDLWTPGDHA